MDDRSRRGDAPLVDWGSRAVGRAVGRAMGRAMGRGRFHHDLRRWWDGRTDGDFHDLANLLVASVDGHGLRYGVHTSKALDGAELVVDGRRPRLRAHHGTDVAVHGRARVVAHHGADLRVRLHEAAWRRELSLVVAAHGHFIAIGKNPGRLWRTIEQLQHIQTQGEMNL